MHAVYLVDILDYRSMVNWQLQLVSLEFFFFGLNNSLLGGKKVIGE